jgi:hypothetical protein
MRQFYTMILYKISDSSCGMGETFSNNTFYLSLIIKELTRDKELQWAKFGSANTKLFHSKATIKFWQNHISMLQDEQGEEQIDHNVKPAILWRAFFFE